MAVDYSEEPKCTQKGTGWVSFDSRPKTVKKRIFKRVKRKLNSRL